MKSLKLTVALVALFLLTGCTMNAKSTAVGQGRSGVYLHLQFGLEQSGYAGQAEGANATNTLDIGVTQPSGS